MSFRTSVVSRISSLGGAPVPRGGTAVQAVRQRASAWAVAYNRWGTSGRGGVVNQRTGAGTKHDKSGWGEFVPTLNISREQLEVIYVQSWAAKKFIDILVEDSVMPWRTFVTDQDEQPDSDSAEEESAADKMTDAEQRHMVRERVAAAMRGGRLFGTAYLLMLTKEAPPEEPLDIEQLREGDLSNLLPVDRYSCRIVDYDYDIWSPDYGKGVLFEFSLPNGPTVFIHSSRVLRFDGIQPPSNDWSVYERQWGISELIPVMLAVTQDAELAQGIAHLTDEASIPVIRMKRFREALSGVSDQDTPDPIDVLTENTMMKSIFRTTVIDAEDEFERVSVNFSGLPQLMDRFANRLAAAADIPETRFWGRAPQGMNATGESDMRNYAMRIASLQTRVLDKPMSVLDQVLARDAGLDEPPDYEWRSLIDLSEKERVEIMAMKVAALTQATSQGMIDEVEARRVLSGDDILGVLEKMPEFLEVEAEMVEARNEAEKKALKNPPDPNAPQAKPKPPG